MLLGLFGGGGGGGGHRRALLKMCMFIVGRNERYGSLSLLYAEVLAAVFRSSLAVMLVRMVINKFGIPAIRNSWYDASQIADHVLQAKSHWNGKCFSYPLILICCFNHI